MMAPVEEDVPEQTPRDSLEPARLDGISVLLLSDSVVQLSIPSTQSIFTIASSYVRVILAFA